MPPCSVKDCPALAAPGSRACTFHGRYHQSSVPQKCARCRKAIRTDEWFEVLATGQHQHARPCSPPEAPRAAR